jgi:hypothetical protein
MTGYRRQAATVCWSMISSGTRDASQAVVRILTEAELAGWRQAKGKRLVRHRGRWWEEVRPGFYHAIHWMARQRRCEAERPQTLCWGFRTTLHDADAAAANGWLPVHLLAEPASYDFETLPSKLRNKLRKCMRSNEIIQVTEPALLRDQGYEVRCSVTERLGIWKPPLKEQYVDGLDQYVGDPRRMILAGVSKGRLGGYLDAFAVDGTAYIDHVYISSSALSTEVGTGLVFEFIQACRRSGSIHEIVYGLDVPSDQSLKQYKVKMGFPVVRIPVRFWLLWPAGPLISWWRPEVYYRLSGIGH